MRFRYCRPERNFFNSIRHFSDMFRCSAAASSQYHCALFCNLCHNTSERIRRYVIDCLSVLYLRKSRIRVYYNRNRSIFCVGFNYRQHFVGTKGAVHTYGIGAKTLKHCNHSLCISPCHQLVSFIIGVCNKHRQIAVFFCRKQSRLCFIGVVHGFYNYEVCSEVYSIFGTLFKNADGFFKLHITHRFYESACRPYIIGYIFVLISFDSFLCAFNGSLRIFCGIVEFKTVYTKGIGGYYIRACFKVGLMNCRYPVRMVYIPLRRLLSGFKSHLLKHSPEASIKIYFSFFNCF